MINKKEIAREAYYQAVKIRKKGKIDIRIPISIFDFAEKLGIQVKFVDTKSMEGLFCKKPNPIILIGAYRPRGRQVFTCAHEIGHFVFNHGTRVDEIREEYNNKDENEFLADCFAGYLLIPPMAINHIMKLKKYNYQSLTPQQVFYLANYFGVGYTSIIYHLYLALGLITKKMMGDLIQHKKKDIIYKTVNIDFNEDLIMIDEFWNHPVDLRVGDYVFSLNHSQYEGNNLILKREFVNNSLYQAITPGISKFSSKENNWAIFCRVSRKEFIGLNKYKHLDEEPDD